MKSTIDGDAHLESLLAGLLGDTQGVSPLKLTQRIQGLWGGQGSLWRAQSRIPGKESLVIKYIAMDREAAHPRGWNTGNSFARKARSYEVECHWYEHYAHRCSAHCKVPQLLAIHRDSQCRVLVLEDLSPDYPVLQDQLSVEQVVPCLQWLAELHAMFLQEPTKGLWEQGCYWHLETRPDEWQAMAEGPLKQAASWLDQRLREARFQTIVHGDAKLANFCFSQDSRRVSAVDFQYVGRGCGMSDVVYFLGSSLSEHDCREYEEYCLSQYFRQLHLALQRRSSEQGGQQFSYTATTAQALEQEWRALYAIAWADFHRFLSGWMPEHSKVNDYGKHLVEQSLSEWPGGADCSE